MNMKRMMVVGMTVFFGAVFGVGCASVSSGTAKPVASDEACLKGADRASARVETERTLLVNDSLRLLRVTIPESCDAFTADTEAVFSDVGPSAAALRTRMEMGLGGPLVVERMGNRVCAGDYVHYQERGEVNPSFCKIARITRVEKLENVPVYMDIE